MQVWGRRRSLFLSRFHDSLQRGVGDLLPQIDIASEEKQEHDKGPCKFRLDISTTNLQEQALIEARAEEDPLGIEILHFPKF
jgi:hypothetical protein